MIVLGYGCIIAAIALFSLGLPDRTGNPARWLRWNAALPLFPVCLMALFAVGVILVIGPSPAGFLSTGVPD
jgi:hypothetical protein